MSALNTPEAEVEPKASTTFTELIASVACTILSVSVPISPLPVSAVKVAESVPVIGTGLPESFVILIALAPPPLPPEMIVDRFSNRFTGLPFESLS